MDAPTPWKPPAALPRLLARDGLVIRYWTPDDAPAMLAALDEDRASYLPWLPWVKIDNRSIAEVIYQVERFRREREAPGALHFTMGIFHEASGGVLGGTGLVRVVADWHEAEIGYWVKPSARGRGVCTRAVAGLIGWAFTDQTQGGWGFRRLIIKCAAANTASRRVPEKLGLRLETQAKAERWVPGIGWADSLTFGVLAEEWDCARGCLRHAGG